MKKLLLLLIFLSQAKLFGFCYPAEDLDEQIVNEAQQLVEQFKPTIHISRITDSDLEAKKKIEPLLFEADTQDPEVKRRNIYKKAVQEYGAQEHVLFTDDDQRISTMLYKRENAPATIIYATGYFDKYTPTKEWCGPLALLNDTYNVLCFDWRGFGMSEGENRFMRKNAFGARAYHDIQAVVDFAKSHPDLKDKPVILHGFCFGGAMVLHATLEAKRHNKPVADAIGLSCIFDRFENLFKRAFMEEDRWFYQLLLKSGVGEAILDYMMNGSLFDVNPIEMIDEVSEMGIPMWFDHALTDRFAPIAGGIEVYNRVKAPKMFVQGDLGKHVRIHGKTPGQYRQAYDLFINKFVLKKNPLTNDAHEQVCQ